MPAASPSDAAYRFERKACVEDLTSEQIEALVRMHPAMFSTLHPTRFVNNVYFDTPDRRGFADNQQGVDRRCKLRIRWYGELLGEQRARLEFKIKRGLVGRKETFDLGPLRVEPGLTRETLRRALQAIELPAPWSELRESADAMLVNRYRRRYYRSADGRYRLTLDDQLEFSPFVAGAATLLHRSLDRRGSVVELKYAPEHDGDAHRVLGAFPFRVTKNSKYVTGMQRLLW